MVNYFVIILFPCDTVLSMLKMLYNWMLPRNNEFVTLAWSRLVLIIFKLFHDFNASVWHKCFQIIESFKIVQKSRIFTAELNFRQNICHGHKIWCSYLKFVSHFVILLGGMNSSFAYEFLRVFSAKCQNSYEFAAPSDFIFLSFL